MIGKTILHYTIKEKLGEGGMGVVYRAEDTRLDRMVAIKFLPEQIASHSEERKRFQVEAKASAALNHPNIATIYAIEEVDDEIFIVMEYIQGRELRDLVQSKVPDLESTKEYALQIAAGLQAAHERHIVHRDIKSANIMITEEGQVKIMDFGLAKVRGSTEMTKVGTTLGTVAYMSPEQARGEEVDHRTDIWSFGIVLYEMLTGRRPFSSDYDQAVIYSILHEEPEFPEWIPAHLRKILEKSLAKDPKSRYGACSEIMTDLHGSHTLSPTGRQELSEKSIVVLPFKNMSPDPDNEYFSDGLTEEIISDLSNLDAIRVICSTSAMQLKGSDKDIRTLGKDLNVQYLLEGSVRKAGSNLRITAQLIDIAKESHLWSGKYTGTLDDIFDIQEQVSGSIVDALSLKLTPEERKRITAHPIEDPRAYDFYFQARQEILKMTAQSLKRALDLIEHSQKIVGHNSLLLSAEGYVHWQYYNSGVESDEKHLDETERCAREIFQLDPESIHGYRLIGLAQAHRNNAADGIRNLKKVIELQPDDVDSLFWLTILPALRGDTAGARSYGERLVKIDPLTPYTHVSVSQAPYYDGNFSEAETVAKRALELDPDNSVWKAWYLLVVSTFWRKERVAALFEEAFKDSEESFFASMAAFYVSALQGDSSTARRVLNEEFTSAAKNDFQYSVFVADGLAMLNETKEAIDWLENAFTRGFANYPFLKEHDPFLRNLDGEERFQQLLMKIKREWELFVGSQR